MTGSSVRDALNELRWHPERDPSRGRVYCRDRAASHGFVVIQGDEVEEVGASSFTARGTTIPHYKVFRVTHGEEVLFERQDQTSS